MDIKIFESRVYPVEFSYRVNSIKDLFDEKNSRQKDFEGLKELTGIKREREAQKKAKDIFVDFLKLLAQDLITKNAIFVFPVFNFGYLKVTERTNFNHPNYYYQFETDGKVYAPRLKITESVMKRTKKIFKFRFTEQLRFQMKDLIESGHKY